MATIMSRVALVHFAVRDNSVFHWMSTLGCDWGAQIDMIDSGWAPEGPIKNDEKRMFLRVNFGGDKKYPKKP